ncbi:MAG: hypothetical protein V4734_13825, partial [Terriglobus sp.]
RRCTQHVLPTPHPHCRDEAKARKGRRMKKTWGAVLGLALVAYHAGTLMAQEKEDRTLLTQEQMTAIINEVSGERAMHNVMEQVPYQFVRPPSEYQGHFREAEAVARMAKEYGFSKVSIEDCRWGSSPLRTTPAAPPISPPWANCGRPHPRA